MKPLVREEIAPLGSYPAVRDAFRNAVIAHKHVRRMAVGPRVTLLFEDRETLRFQVQEMLWVERIEDAGRVQHELDVYNELMPGPGELSATLFIEITEPGSIRPELDRLIGLDEHVVLVLGSGEAAIRIPARFDAKQFEEDRISAVQYVRFALGPGDVERLGDPAVAASIQIEHPAYRQDARIPDAVRASLVAGLRHDPEPLMPAIAAPTDAADELLFEGGNARVVRPAVPRVPGELRVESSEVWPERGAVDDAAWSDAMDALRRAVELTIAERGSCRVFAELVPGAQPAWRVLPGSGA